VWGEEVRILILCSQYAEDGSPNPDAVDMILHFVTLDRATGSPIDLVYLSEMGIFSPQFTGRLSPAVVSLVNFGKDAKKAATIKDPQLECDKSRLDMVQLCMRTFGVTSEADDVDPRLALLANREAVVRAIEDELQVVVFIDDRDNYSTYKSLLKCVTTARTTLHSDQLRRTCTLLANKCTELKVLSLAARTQFRKSLDNLIATVDDFYKMKVLDLGGIDAIKDKFSGKCSKVLRRLQKEELGEHILLTPSKEATTRLTSRSSTSSSSSTTSSTKVSTI
jgi:hypothetical protein